MSDRTQNCAGCRDDFYNDKNPMGVKECWALKTAKMVTQFRIGTWTQPTKPGAFTKVKKLNCWHGDGVHFYGRLPDFVSAKDVNNG